VPDPDGRASGPPGADADAEAVAGADDAAAGADAEAAAGAGGSGPDLARAVLDAARARRAPARRRAGGKEGRAARGRAWSGAGPDARDPQPFGSVLGALMKSRGWDRPAAEARLFGMWEQVVGPEVAAHSRPVRLEEGVLTVEATSTAWAAQLRLLAGSLVKKIAADIGHRVVISLRVHGPAAPDWNRGPRRVRGRGPRDTYG
jgi:predicted nucleic acid-binding Zn ribbon protein